MYRSFFFNDTATTEIYTLSLHDALPILERAAVRSAAGRPRRAARPERQAGHQLDLVREGEQRLAGIGGRLLRHADRKSTRLNSSHANISYAVFCLKKKKKTNIIIQLY